MSKYIITIQKTDYIPEGNSLKQSTVFQQETNDDDCVRRVAIAVNNPRIKTTEEIFGELTFPPEVLTKLKERILAL